MPKAVIFGVNGILIGPVDLHARAWQNTFSDFDHEVASGDVRSQMGKCDDQLMPAFLSKEKLDARGEALDEYHGQVPKERYLPQITLLPGCATRCRGCKPTAPDRLGHLRQEDELQAYKLAAGTENLLDAEGSSDDAEESKPAPEIFSIVIRHLGGLIPEQVTMIGYTSYDTGAAAKAGLHTIDLPCGGWSEVDLKKAGCIATYKDPADLLAQYDTSPLAPSQA